MMRSAVFGSSLLSAVVLAAELPPEMPELRATNDYSGNFFLNWDTVTGQSYRVESNPTLNPTTWSPAGDWRVADGNNMTHQVPASGTKKFFRLAVTPEDFAPTELAPLWQLDATTDFSSTADGAAVSKWTGSGLVSAVQSTAARRPVFSGQSLVFDGVDDHLSFPMWPQGVDTDWTIAALIKVREGIRRDACLFGGDWSANNALTMSNIEGALFTSIPGYSGLMSVEECAMSANENWRVIIIRSSGTQFKVWLDWYQGIVAGSPNTTGATGNFNVGCGWGATQTAAPVSVRYLAYFPSSLGDEETGKLARWLERKKLNEYPPVALFFGGGQSNFLSSLNSLRPELISSFGNTAYAFGPIYGGTSLCMWMRDNDAGTGYEVTPYYDLSAAPPNSKAPYYQIRHSGTKVIDDWNKRASAVRKNPKSLAACIFVQGESDTGDARTVWKPNGNGDYNTTFSEPFHLVDTYGARARAWNTEVRAQTGFPGMFFVYETVTFAPWFGLVPGQAEGILRQRRSLIDSLRHDPRCFVVDTTELPRPDGVHFSRPADVPAEVPNTGAERFARSTSRLLAQGPALAALDYDARMLAMRALDSGFVLDAPKLEACRTFAAHPLFPKLKSLVIPTLPSANAVDQERLRRCNLVLHLKALDGVPFVATAPPNCQVVCEPGTDTAALGMALAGLLQAWGVPGPVDFL